MAITRGDLANAVQLDERVGGQIRKAAPNTNHNGTDHPSQANVSQAETGDENLKCARDH